ncbi:MAG: choice-of-anchor Q domain-containing protein, partial [Polyangiales bacterium]
EEGATCEIGYSAIDGACSNSEDAPLVSLGHNRMLDLGTDTCALSGLSDQVLTSDEMALGLLDFHGGQTPTHLPSSESLLIDAIAAEVCHADVLEDQRGKPRDGSSPCDVGAVEVQPDD